MAGSNAATGGADARRGTCSAPVPRAVVAPFRPNDPVAPAAAASAAAASFLWIVECASLCPAQSEASLGGRRTSGRRMLRPCSVRRCNGPSGSTRWLLPFFLLPRLTTSTNLFLFQVQLQSLAERARYDPTIAGALFKRTSDGAKWQLRWFTLYQVSPSRSFHSPFLWRNKEAIAVRLSARRVDRGKLKQ